MPPCASDSFRIDSLSCQATGFWFPRNHISITIYNLGATHIVTSVAVDNLLACLSSECIEFASADALADREVIAAINHSMNVEYNINTLCLIMSRT